MYQFVGESTYTDYVANATNVACETDVEKLRADLGECIRKI